MSRLSLEVFDKHIENLRSQLQFLNEALEATDHNAPDWLATDLLSLRNKSGRLQDDMQRFKDHLEGEGLGTSKTSNKRLSIEGAKPPTRPTHQNPMLQVPYTSPSSNQSSRPLPTPPKPEDDYIAQHIDVTEEVNRRLRESRLRRLMDSPSTSQKRKRDAFEGSSMGAGEDMDEMQQSHDSQRTPTKKVKASGFLESALKRKTIGIAPKEQGERNGERMDFKRRRIWSDNA